MCTVFQSVIKVQNLSDWWNRQITQAAPNTGFQLFGARSIGLYLLCNLYNTNRKRIYYYYTTA